MYPYAIRVNLVFLSISCFIPSLHPEVFRWFQKHDQFQIINIFFMLHCYKNGTSVINTALCFLKEEKMSYQMPLIEMLLVYVIMSDLGAIFSIFLHKSYLISK